MKGLQKILLTLSTAMFCLLILAGCFEGVVSQRTTITNAQGAGERQMTIRVYRDGALSPDNSGDIVDGNHRFLPNGGFAIYEAVSAAKPTEWNWLSVNWHSAEQEGRSDYDEIRFTMTFDSLEAYNEQAKLMSQEQPFTPALLYEEGNELIYREPLMNIRSGINWILTAVYGENGENPGVFSASQGGTAAPITKDEMIKFLELRVNLLGEEVVLYPPFNLPGQVVTVIHPLGDVDQSRPIVTVEEHGQTWSDAVPDRGGFDPSGLEATPNDAWTELFNRQHGWLGADGIFSIPLDGHDTIGASTSDTRTFFTFADTTIGEADNQLEHFKLGWRIANQSAATLIGTEPDPEKITFHFRQDEVAGTVSNLYPNSTHTWPSDGIVIDQAIHMLAQTVDDQMNPLAIQEITVPLVDGEPRFEASTLVSRPDLYFNDGVDVEISFTNAIYDNSEASGAVNPDGYLYVYGFRNIKSKGLKQLVLARVLKASFSDTSSWEFFANGTWSTSITDLNHDDISLADHVSPEVSVTYIPDGPFAGKYLLVYQHDTISPYIVMRTADTLTGPFSEPTWLYTIPEQSIYHSLPQGETITYNTKAHPHLSPEGKLLLSYNVNVWFGVPTSTEIYRPRFLTVDLTGAASEALVPNHDHENILFGKIGDASHGQDVASYATDGVVNPAIDQAWEAASLEPKTLAFDLGKPHRLDRWRVQHASYAGMPTVSNTLDYALQVSMNGKKWRTVDHIAYNHASVSDRVFPEQQARYVRLLILKDTQSKEPVSRIYELEIFGRSLASN